MSWTAGCVGASGLRYSLADDAILVRSQAGASFGDCSSRSSTADAIGALVDGGRAIWRIEDGFLYLATANVELKLRPVPATSGPDALDTTTLVGSMWTIVELSNLGDLVALPADGLQVQFLDQTISWHDACNSASTPVSYGSGTISQTGRTDSAQVECPSQGRDLVWDVFSPQTWDVDPAMDVYRDGDRLVLRRGGLLVTLSPA
jgi:hypothetical protein